MIFISCTLQIGIPGHKAVHDPGTGHPEQIPPGYFRQRVPLFGDKVFIRAGAETKIIVNNKPPPDLR